MGNDQILKCLLDLVGTSRISRAVQYEHGGLGYSFSGDSNWLLSREAERPTAQRLCRANVLATLYNASGHPPARTVHAMGAHHVTSAFSRSKYFCRSLATFGAMMAWQYGWCVCPR